MMSIIRTLRERNLILVNFYIRNSQQINAMKNSSEQTNIESFYLEREDMFKELDMLNKTLAKQIRGLGATDTKETKEFKQKIQDELSAKDCLSQSILKQDLEILSMIDEIKSKLIKRLSSERTISA